MKRNEHLALLRSQRALQAAVLARDYDAVRQWLTNGGDATALWRGERHDDTYPLILAVEGNDVEMVRLLAQAGMPLYHNAALAQKVYGPVEPLTLVSLWRPGNHEAVMVLLDLGAEIHSAVYDHMPILRLTELHESQLDARSDALFQRILDANLDVDAPWDETQNILHLICVGNNRYVPILIGLSRNVHAAVGNPFNTPLLSAIRAGSDQAVKALLAQGADPNAFAWKGKSLVELAYHVKEMDKIKNLRGQMDRIITMLEATSKLYVPSAPSI